MFVSRCIDVEAGKACLEGHLKRLHDRPHVDVRTNVLRVTSNSMLSVIGSVTLAIIKRVEAALLLYRSLPHRAKLGGAVDG
ncbi:hypothetical protein HaLaN_14033 [Haematococcus lacustris]|uniref:Uncharacterized protein n=1 Tax=Haematococcus lacustris TaxID=44745 RepID=A0A699ZNG8_HAELA|nr:hypothetical protein HaLaN_14033 [Haematococcus lacustris]